MNEWLPTGTPPWLLWGNTQQLQLTLRAGQIFGTPSPTQLTKVDYARPETWSWLFTCRLISADNPLAGQTMNISVVWELTTGIGRSVQQNLGFDNYNFGPIVNPATFPVGRLIWTTETIATDPGRAGIVAPPVNLIREINGQSINLNVRAAITTDVTQLVDQNAVIEVGAQWAPKSHVRPEWYKDPPEFSGSEQAGH